QLATPRVLHDGVRAGGAVHVREPGAHAFGFQQLFEFVAGPSAGEAHGDGGVAEPGHDAADVDALPAGSAQDGAGPDGVVEHEVRHLVGDVEGGVRGERVDHDRTTRTSA